MSFLRKSPNISLNSLSILRRRFATLTTAKPFPDDPTSADYDELAAASFVSGDHESLRDLLNKRVQDRCYNTKRTFKFITHKNLSPSLVDDVVKTLSTLNPGFTRRNAFDSLVTRLCSLKRPDDALRVAESMSRVGGCEPTTSTFYPILSLLTREKSFDDARRAVEAMARLNLRLDLTVHNIFLGAHCFAGDIDAAAGVLKEMEKEGLGADARTFDALVLGACRAGKVEGAMVLVRRMVDDGVPMLYSTHMYVIEALLKMGCYEQAVRYVKGFSGKDRVLDSEIFGCLGIKLVRLRRFEEAMLVLSEMKKRGLTMGYKLRDFYEMRV